VEPNVENGEGSGNSAGFLSCCGEQQMRIAFSFNKFRIAFLVERGTGLDTEHARQRRAELESISAT
jgi:hypothetical protein